MAIGLEEAYRGRRVLLTGHTGFKGSWLALWLRDLGAQVTGVALPPPEGPSHFVALGLQQSIDHRVIDIRDTDRLRACFAEVRPEMVFHLAAQALVRDAYADPKRTFDVNAGGTVSVLECLRQTQSVRSAVLVTSDKCYENVETHRPYREDDGLGGRDPYSASKAAAELAIAAYRLSFFKDGPAVASVRAGNVIGGGDWARDRIVPDCARALAAGKPIVIRNPNAFRPWQHVLDPLAGYLQLGAHLAFDPGSCDRAFNFGPDPGPPLTVQMLAARFVEAWGRGSIQTAEDAAAPHEAERLALDSARARETLGWRPRLPAAEGVAWTVEWYRAWQDGHLLSPDQLKRYRKDVP